MKPLTNPGGISQISLAIFPLFPIAENVPSSQLGNFPTLLHKWFVYQSFLSPRKLKENSRYQKFPFYVCRGKNIIRDCSEKTYKSLILITKHGDF
jgi:hypothetical protein